MLGSKIISVGTALAVGGIINRSLGPSGRGIYAEMQTWIAMFAVIFNISMNSAIYHFSNKSLHVYDDESRFITILYLSFTYAVMAALSLTASVYLMPWYFSAEFGKYILLLDIFLITFMTVTNLSVFIQSLGNLRYSAIIAVVQSAVNILVIGGAYTLGVINIRFVLISLLIFQGVALVMLCVGFMKAGFFRGRFSKDLARGMLSTGLKIHLGVISTFVYTKINQLIVFKYCGDYEAGIFAVSLNLAFAIIFIPATLQTVLYPRVIHSDDDFEVTIRSLRVGFYGWGFMVILIMFFAKPILLIYGGKEFLPSVSTFRILMISAWFLPLSSMVAPYCIKVGAFLALSATALLWGIMSIGLNLLLVPAYSGVGAALSTSLICFTGFPLSIGLLWFLSRKNPLGFMNLKAVF